MAKLAVEVRFRNLMDAISESIETASDEEILEESEPGDLESATGIIESAISEATTCR